jgi:hypothetical protein
MLSIILSGQPYREPGAPPNSGHSGMANGTTKEQIVRNEFILINDK